MADKLYRNDYASRADYNAALAAQKASPTTTTPTATKLPATGQGPTRNTNLYTPGSVVTTDKGTTTYGAITEQKGKVTTQKQTFVPTPKPKYEPVPTEKGAEADKWERIRKGVFFNESTGKYTDARGNVVDYDQPVRQVGGLSTLTPQTAQDAIDAASMYFSDPKDISTPWGVTGSTGDTIFGEPEEPETIDGALEQKTYEEQAEEQFRGQFKTDMENAKKWGITLPYKTFEEFMEWRKNANQEDIDYLTEQQNIAREMEASQAMRAGQQMAGATAATEAAMAQSREGPISSIKPMIVSEFKAEMDRQAKQIQLERQSAENQRQRAMTELKRAQEAGDIDLAAAIQGQLSSIESNIRQIDADALNAATLANEQAMKAMEAASQKTATVTENLFNLGSIASSLSYDQLQNMITGTDMTMPQALAIQQAAVLQGKALETKNEAEAVKLQAQAQDLLATAGKTTEQLNFEYFNKLSDTDKASYLNLKRDNPNMQLVDMGDGSYGSYDPATGKLSVTYTPSNLDQSNVGSVFYQEGESDYGWGEGKRECGEGYNDVTEGEKVGDSWDSKLGATTKRDNPQIGNGLAIPIGSPDIGHIGTVIEVNGDTIRTVEWNHNGDGQQTVETYSVDQLNQRHGDNWGFTDSKLKEKYQVGLSQAKSSKLSETAKQVMENPSLLGNYTSTMKGKILTELANAGIELKEIATPEQVKLLNQMNDDVRAEPLYKQNVEIQNGFQNVTIGAGLNNAQGDLAIVNGFAKMLDPTGVVRPAEFETVEEAQSFFEKSLNYPRKIYSGDRLSDEARLKFADAAEALYSEKIKTFNNLIDSKYLPTAEYSGIPLDLVQNLKAPTIEQIKNADIDEVDPWGFIDTESADDLLNQF